MTMDASQGKRVDGSMNQLEDLFQERLERLERGEPLEACAAGLPEREVELLALAAGLGKLAYPAPRQEASAMQRAALLRLAEKERTVSPRSIDVERRRAVTARPRWFIPAALAAAAVLLLACALVALVAGGALWRALRYSSPTHGTGTVAVAGVDKGAGVSPLSSPTSVPGTAQPVAPLPAATATVAVAASSTSTYTVFVPVSLNPMPPDRAVLRVAQGVVEVQGDGVVWAAAVKGQVLQAGQRVRTGALSGAQLLFCDGSTAQMGPQSEVEIDRLGQDPEDGARIVEISQLAGETDHDVVTAASERARYQVHTPSGTAAARGTAFHVLVTPAHGARFGVDEGAVAVTNLQVTVIVGAGQVTIVDVDHTPSQPFFRITGEGGVTQTGDTWTIGGQEFRMHDDTVVVGNPQVGDWVFVDGHLLTDGTRVADLIVLLRRAPQERFTLSGPVEAIGGESWTVAGQVLTVTEQTEIETGIAIGDLVEATGVVLPGGGLVAEQIRMMDSKSGVPFYLVGVVQAMGDEVWAVSGISITVGIETEVDPDIAVGNTVAVRGWIQADGSWQARSIRRLEVPEGTFEFSGVVESIDPWVVSGVPLETGAWTEIEAGIAISDTVRVEGRILENGVWQADEIELLEENLLPTLEFVGTVEQIDPWVVSGISLTVDSETVIRGTIVVGTRVRVKVEILEDGAWRVREIEPVGFDPGVGCMRLAAIVIRLDARQIVLKDGTTLPLEAGTQIDGALQARSIIWIELCIDTDGHVIVVRIVVIGLPGAIVVPVQPTATPGAPAPAPREETVTICHKPGTPAEQTKRVPVSALAGHLGHGDTLGPCP
jgi:hypothetical protein